MFDTTLLPTPYRLLAAVLLLFAVFCSGAYLGYQYADGRNAKATANAQERALEAARQQSAADKVATIERVRRETLAAERARSAREKGMNDAIDKASSSCSRDTESLRLLMDAIGAANGTEAGAGGVPKALPTRSGAQGWLGQGDKALGVRYH